MKMRSRKIEVPKMRGTTHSNFLHPFVIGQDGIEVKAEPEVTKRLRRAIFKAKNVEAATLQTGFYASGPAWAD